MSTSTSAPQPPKLSAGGRAIISSLVILANPRMLPASKYLVLDAQFYLGSMDQGLIMGSLRYFNSDNATFDEEPSLYFVHTSVSICFMICFLIHNVSSLLDENQRLMYLFLATERIWIISLLVT
jgi:hypothetical protein